MSEDQPNRKGIFKIYLGYAAGVGKTYAMLKEAQRLKSRGFDVVIGYLEPHERQETIDQSLSLEILPLQNQLQTPEMDTEAILVRNPQFALVDELAHSNAPSSKYEKRYQDVFELLDHGISVISTLNVQHLESVADNMTSSIGVEIRERVPDFVLQRADQIVTVDVSIDELRERLRSGKIYKKEQAERALNHFFSQPNLSILREWTLKEAATDQIRRIDEQVLLSKEAVKLAHGDVMVCLGLDPIHAKTLVKRGTRFAIQMAAHCYVVYVQKRSEAATSIDATLQRKLQNNLALAKHLGAEVFMLQGEKISDVLVRFATEKNIRHAVFGKSRLSPFQERLRGSVISEFIYDAIGVDVHILGASVGE